ncbi:MAG TPA: SAF domain-containing protein [Nocardioidaceae bacterium]|jgi:Flp pilus assembly protein CpaB
MTDLRGRLTVARRWLVRFRRPLAALCAGGCVLAVVHVVAPPAPATTSVLVAAHRIAGGTTLSADDVVMVARPTGAVPPTAFRSLRQALGRTVAGPIDADEVLTPARLVGPRLAAGFGPDEVACPVRLADADMVDLLSVGDRVDVYAPTAGGREASRIALDAPVVAIPVPSDDMSRSEGGLVVLAVSSPVAGRLAQQAAKAPLSVTLRP